MSAGLWHFFLEDDVESFRQLLANATYTSGPQKVGGGGGDIGRSAPKTSSPVALATSPKNSTKSRKGSYGAQYQHAPSDKSHGLALTRADVNSKDNFGRTILHLAASSTSDTAIGFVTALLEVPFLDLYIQDLESGWTALHRALYFGNVATAQALMLRDSKNATDYTRGSLHHNAGGLVKIKDHEGNSPFEVFALTIASRILLPNPNTLSASAEDDDSTGSLTAEDPEAEERGQKQTIRPLVNLLGDEILAFGSNKNLSLGLGDEDDRQYPERLNLKRPDHLLRRFHHEYLAARRKSSTTHDLPNDDPGTPVEVDLPAVFRAQPLVFQDVVMSKFHTAVITNDPESNLFTCGYGPGGRLGTGDETTRFNLVCIETGGLTGKKVSAVALGQDHSIAVTSSGEVLTWGSNRHGQLGYILPQPLSVQDAPMQLTPRQLFGPLKREVVVGAAASSIHSVVFTTSALYTFGKNEGQLGLMDADARSLETLIAPRRVGVSVLQSNIQMVSAIERATSILLENHDVIIFTHFGWTRLLFQLESFTNYFLEGSSATRYDPAGNFICKVTSGGNTICAMSRFGEVFTLDVARKVDSAAAWMSTTNPTKARNALPNPSQVWSIKKSHMAAQDVAVGQDGAIILSTVSGSVWRKEKRAKIKDMNLKTLALPRTKDYKFVRIPNLTRAVAVRSNAYGAFTAVRRDCDVTKEQIAIDPPSLWTDIYPLLAFRDYTPPDGDSDTEHTVPRFWTPAVKTDSPALIRQAVLLAQDPEKEIEHLLKMYEPLSHSQYDLWITSNVTEVRFPAHAFLMKARSRVLRHALSEFQRNYYFSIPGCVSIEYGEDGQIQVQFPGADFLTIFNLVYYVYTENVVDMWHNTHRRPLSAARFRQVRLEIMKIAIHLEMRQLERAVRVMVDPVRCLNSDLESAHLEADFYSDADVVIELADDVEMPAHSALLCRRCPFFDGLFHGRAEGRWISSRRNLAEETAEAVKVELKHVDAMVFQIVRRHIYADTGEEIFDAVVTKDLDEFIDLVLDVMSVANELMLDRLAQVCQKVLGNFVASRNVCQLLNAVSPCSATEFKDVGLEYICLNLESMLEHRLLEELDQDLFVELDQTVRQNQLTYLPFARSGRAMAALLDLHPYLPGQIDQARQRRIDSMRLQSRLHENEGRSLNLNKLRTGSWEPNPRFPASGKWPQTPPQRVRSHDVSPALASKDSHPELLFEMDEEQSFTGMETATTPGLGSQGSSSTRLAPGSSNQLPFLANKNDPRSEANDVARSFDTQASSLPNLSTRHSQGQVSPKDFRNPQAPDSTFASPKAELPWNVVTPISGRIGLKDIMAQATADRRSSLTLAMSAKEADTGRGGYRLSQKDRRKLQYRESHSQESVQSPASPAEPSTQNPISPWQRPPPAAETASGSREANISAQDGLILSASRPSARSGMTMRQTLAGHQSMDAPQPAKQSRRVSSPAVTPASKPLPPQIHSIRHFPPPSGLLSTAALPSSMADILAQQANEKTAVEEAAAKRSLQDIQQEQEFQEWWDSESRKLQEEEATANETTRRGRGRGSRGRAGHRRGSGRGVSSHNGATKERATK